MPNKPFRVSVFEVRLPEDADGASSAFENAITLAYKAPINERLKDINGKYRRLENYDLSGAYSLLNFITLAFDGPGRSALESPAVPINLEADENFSYETAMLYDPEENLVFLESGQGGMGPGAVARYFRGFTEHQEEYLLIPRLDAEASARARRYQTIRGFTFRAATGQVTNIDHDAGIAPMKAFSDGFGAETMKFEIKAGRAIGQTLSINNIWRLIDNILGSNSDNNVTELKLYGREHDDDALELIDLIQHREKRERMLDVDPDSRNVPHEARWQALLNIRKEFIV